LSTSSALASAAGGGISGFSATVSAGAVDEISSSAADVDKGSPTPSSTSIRKPVSSRDIGKRFQFAMGGMVR
jgi:hypothetical protein